MKCITVTPIERTYRNWGQHCEQALAYTLTGEMRTADILPFDKYSDIPEYEMSVKASHFSLASPHINFGATKEEKLADYQARVHSKLFAYVTMEMKAYIMNLIEWMVFLDKFTTLDQESGTHIKKVRGKVENKEIRAWLAAHATMA